jgi:uncharacterized protein DUF3617
MRIARSFLVSTCTACLIGTAVFAWAQSRKAGLWEMTTTMTLQQSPFPAGMQPPPNSPLSATPHTTQICLTQEMIDKFGAPVPSSNNECQLANVQKNDHGITADLVCTGRMSGKGSLQSDLIDPEHAKGKVHFVGSVQARSGSMPIEWTSESTSVFKSTDCGNVKPVPMPEK